MCRTPTTPPTPPSAIRLIRTNTNVRDLLGFATTPGQQPGDRVTSPAVARKTRRTQPAAGAHPAARNGPSRRPRPANRYIR